MDANGFFRVRAQVPIVKIADTEFNANGLIEAVKNAEESLVDCLVFPELSVTGYTCADLFHQYILLKNCEQEIERIATETSHCDVLFAIGAPVPFLDKIYNCAVLLYKGKIQGIVPKIYLPNYNEFYEKRWFESGRNIKKAELSYAGQNVYIGSDLLFQFKGVKIGVEICEDLWVPQPPSGEMAMAGADVILNLSASDELIGKHDYLLSLISQQSARCRCAYVYSSAGWGESSTDLVFIGKAIIGEDGEIFGKENKFLTGSFNETRDVDINKLRLERNRFNTFTEFNRFFEKFNIIEVCQNQPLFQHLKNDNEIDPYPFIPQNTLKLSQRCEEIINIQSYGLMKRLDAIKCKKAVVGISGGLDSTLALLVTVNAFNKLGLPLTGIIGVTMPGMATTSRTKNNATALMETLGVSVLEIPIKDVVELHFRDIGHQKDLFDITYENSQARERTQILMDLANKENAIVIGTGDMSELALGWCTYNGDQMSMYGVNASVPKTLVKHLVKWFASKSEKQISQILLDICDTPISPELVPSGNDVISQKTEDLVGPYELHDFFLYHFLRNSFSPRKIFDLSMKAYGSIYDKKVILKWLKIFFKRFFSQQFKRSCMPDGPKVGSVNLSPRGDWRMPSDASPEIWLKQLEEIENERES